MPAQGGGEGSGGEGVDGRWWRTGGGGGGRWLRRGARARLLSHAVCLCCLSARRARPPSRIAHRGDRGERAPSTKPLVIIFGRRYAVTNRRSKKSTTNPYFSLKTVFFLAVLWNRSGRQTERSGPVGKRSGRLTERSGPVGNSVGPPDRALWHLGRWCRGSTERSRRASPHREERLLEHGSCAARDALMHVHALPRTRATARAPTVRPSLSLAASTAPLALCGL